MEIDKTDTSVVTPVISQSDAGPIHEATTSIFLISKGDNNRYTGVANFVDENPLRGGDPDDVSKECVPPKIE